MDLKATQKVDPLKKQAESGVDTEGLNPMAAPEGFNPPSLETVPVSEMHPFLQSLVAEHKEFVEKLDDFEKALSVIPDNGITKEADKGIRDFFHYFDHQLVEHHRREDTELFPILKRVLPLSEGYTQGSAAQSPVEIMEDDHVRTLQSAAVIFNFFGLVSRLPDSKSQVLVLDAALEQAKEFIEILRLHIFREDNVLFPLAHKHLDKSAFDKMMPKQ